MGNNFIGKIMKILQILFKRDFELKNENNQIN